MAQESGADRQVVDESVPPQRFIFARAATLMLTATDKEPAEQTLRKVVERISNDVRVPSKVHEPEMTEDLGYWSRIFPRLRQRARTTALTGNDARFAMRFIWPIALTIRVAAQHQPVHLDIDDAPTDTYAVAWDGINAIVVWEQDKPLAAVSAGHAALEVLEDAIIAAGYSAYSQGCSPGCDYMFMHTAMRYAGLSGDRSGHWSKTDEFNLVDMTLPDPIADLEDAAVEVWYALHNMLSEFAAFKNIGRRLLDLEDICRDDLEHLLSHNYSHAKAKLLPLRRKPKAWWRNRRWRYEARALIASLWLSQANMESLLREWEEARTNLLDAPSDALAILDLDYKGDQRAIESMKMDRIGDAVHQVVEVMDSRFISLATAFGAIGGGVVGSALTLLAH